MSAQPRPEGLKKPNANSPLQLLPEERRAHIMEMLEGKSYEDVRKILADDGFKTSIRALKEFYSWYQLRQLFKEDRDMSDQFEEELKNFDPSMPKETISLFGDRVFLKLAIKRQDNLEWVRLRREEAREKQNALQERRIAVLEKKAAQADQAKEVINSTLTPEEQRERLREILQ
jgi:hypothetical protein